METTTKTLTDMLVERLSVWDEIDEAYDKNLLKRVCDLTTYLTKELNPKIREAYGL